MVLWPWIETVVMICAVIAPTGACEESACGDAQLTATITACNQVVSRHRGFISHAS